MPSSSQICLHLFINFSIINVALSSLNHEENLVGSGIGKLPLLHGVIVITHSKSSLFTSAFNISCGHSPSLFCRNAGPRVHSVGKTERSCFSSGYIGYIQVCRYVSPFTHVCTFVYFAQPVSDVRFISTRAVFYPM